MVKDILDVTCSTRSIWFDKSNPRVLFCDKRSLSVKLSGGETIHIKPDVIADFTDLPFPDESFKLVIFDPPHLDNLGSTSDLALKYGKLFPGWEDEIRKGFDECFRVLKKDGILVFKWNEHRFKQNRILNLIKQKPLIGHTTGSKSQTIWMLFIKY